MEWANIELNLLLWIWEKFMKGAWGASNLNVYERYSNIYIEKFIKISRWITF